MVFYDKNGTEISAGDYIIPEDGQELFILMCHYYEDISKYCILGQQVKDVWAFSALTQEQISEQWSKEELDEVSNLEAMNTLLGIKVTDLSARPTTREKIEKSRKVIEKAVQNLSDEEAVLVPTLFPIWSEDTEYEINTRVCYNEVLYKVNQTHTSQAEQTPDITTDIYSALN